MKKGCWEVSIELGVSLQSRRIQFSCIIESFDVSTPGKRQLKKENKKKEKKKRRSQNWYLERRGGRGINSIEGRGEEKEAMRKTRLQLMGGKEKRKEKRH